MATGERFGSIFDGGSALGLGSAELLERFARRRDEAAFTALVAHHGPMVLATCRRILPEQADADDAFQATFLVLAKKAASISDPDRLAPWLHGVARRVSVRARSVAARRRAIEGQGQGDVAVAPMTDDAHDLRLVLDEELARLPEKYRIPLVLCYLEGLTHDEAASQLKWPIGTVRSRLAGARDRLRSSLTRRGYAAPSLVVLSPPTLPSAVVSRFLQAATVRLVFTSSAGSTVATSAAALLAQGALTSMFYAKVQTIAALAATMTIATVGVVTAHPRGEAEVQPVANAAPPAVPPVIPDQATPPANLAQELDAAKDRIKTLEAELAALKARNSQMPPPASADIPTPPPTPAQPGGAASGQPPLEKAPTLEELKAKYPPTPATPATPEPRATPRSTATTTITKRATDDPSRGPATTTSTYTTNIEETATPPQTPTPPSRAVRPAALAAAQKAAYSGSWTIPLAAGRILVSPAERDRATVVATVSGKKATYRVSENIKKIIPVFLAGDNLLGLELEGPKVAEVAAYSFAENVWSMQELREPVLNGTISPVVGAHMVRYTVGRFLYIFSPEANRWGVLELKVTPSFHNNGLPPGTISSDDGLIIREDDTLHVYRHTTGEWTHINTKDDK